MERHIGLTMERVGNKRNAWVTSYPPYESCGFLEFRRVRNSLRTVKDHPTQHWLDDGAPHWLDDGARG